MADTVTTTTPVTGSTPSPEQAPKQKRGETRQAIYPSLEAATAEAASRTSGHRDVYIVSFKDGTKYHVVSNHPAAALMSVHLNRGGVVEKLGGVSRVQKPAGVPDIMAAIGNLPEDQMKAIMEQVKALEAEKAKAAKAAAKK